MHSSPLSGERRRWPVAEKCRIVELTMRENTSVIEIAKQFHLDPPTLSSWRTLYRQGKLQPKKNHPQKSNVSPALLPVVISDDPVLPSAAHTHVRIALPSGTSIHIETEMTSFAELGALFVALLP